MLGISLNHDSLCSLYAVICKYSVKVCHGFFRIIREDHSLAAVFQILDDRIFFCLGNITCRCVDQQAGCIIRHALFCQKIQGLDIDIRFLDIFF